MPVSAAHEPTNAQFSLKRLPCTFLPSVLLGLLLGMPPLAWAATLHVPSQYATIQQAIEAAAADDEILVAPGLYDENLDTKGKRLILRGESGADATIVDGGRRNPVLILSGGGSVEGLTLRNGYAEDNGGGMRILSSVPAVIRNNIIENNEVGFFDSGNGGGIYLGFTTSGVLIEFNTIRGNSAGDSGGGIYDVGSGNAIRRNDISWNRCHVCGGGSFGGTVVEGNLVANNFSDSFGGGLCVGGGRVENNTVVGNKTGGVIADNGAGIHVRGGIAWVIRNIVVGNGSPGTRGGGVLCSSEFSTRIECNDSWGNVGSDYLLFGTCDTTGSGNFSLDPLFCDAASGDYRLHATSPCTPDSSNGCGLVGAFPVGCGATPLRPSSWGRVKATYR